MSSPPRPSKFIEGSPLTGPDLLTRTPTTAEHFQRILSEMDEIENRKRRHRDSNASASSTSSSPSQSSASTLHLNVIAGLREIEFGGKSEGGRRSLDVSEKRELGEEKFAVASGLGRLNIKGRLRALTVGNTSSKTTPCSGT